MEESGGGCGSLTSSSNTTTFRRQGKQYQYHTEQQQRRKHHNTNMINSSEEDTLDGFEADEGSDRAEDVFEERERNLEIFLQKINAELQLCSDAAVASNMSPPHQHNALGGFGGALKTCEKQLLSLSPVTATAYVSHSRHSSDPVFLSPETPEIFAPSFKFLYS